MVKTPHFHCRGHRLDPWYGSLVWELRYHMLSGAAKINTYDFLNDDISYRVLGL